MKSSFFSSYLNYLICIKFVPLVLVVVDVPQLVAHDSRIANHGVDVRVRMAVDPYINATASDEITQFRGESAIQH